MARPKIGRFGSVPTRSFSIFPDFLSFNAGADIYEMASDSNGRITGRHAQNELMSCGILMQERDG
jgi:hypothetical protein